MYSELVKKLKKLNKAGVIVVEGFSGSGKTTLAQKLSKTLNIQNLDTDCYVVKKSDSEPYLSLLDLVHLKEVADSIIYPGKSLIFSGICAQDTLKKLSIKPVFRIYVKKIARSELWHEGFDIESYVNGNEPSEYYEKQPHKSDMDYHIRMKPHECPDFIYKYVRD